MIEISEILSNEEILARAIHILFNLNRLKEEFNCVYNDENIHQDIKLIFIILCTVKLLKMKDEIDHLRLFL